VGGIASTVAFDPLTACAERIPAIGDERAEDMLGIGRRR